MAAKDKGGRDTLTIRDNRTGKDYEVEIHEGDVIRAMDLRKIKVHDDDFGMMSFDPAFTNTASTRSAVTFIDGDKGILRYRGYPIEQLAERTTFLEVAYLILKRELPSQLQLDDFVQDITYHTYVHENILTVLDGFRYDAHAMGMLISSTAALSTFYPGQQGHPEYQVPLGPDGPGGRQDPDARCLRIPPPSGPPLRLSRERALLHGELLEHAVSDRRKGIPAESGARAGSRDPVRSTRGSRAELLHDRDAFDRLVRGRPLRFARWFHGGPLRAAPWRGERGGPPHAQPHRESGEHPGLPGQGEEQGREVDGVRSPRVQGVRPTSEYHQADR